jgi:pyruvate kinase
MDVQILVTLGPSSLSQETVKKIAQHNIYLFRINLSHTHLEAVAETIAKVQKWSEVPICIDSEGAQIRNQTMNGHPVKFATGEPVRIHFDDIDGDANNVSLTPRGVARELVVGDRLRIDFDAACIKVVERHRGHCLSVVENSGRVGSNKAVDLDRRVSLKAVTAKDRAAVAVAKKMGIRHFALSFANSREDVDCMRTLIGADAVLISKVESADGVLNLGGILESSDEILIDRGDLSRQVPIEKIPFLQRRIISMARAKDTPVHVATNLLESMIDACQPTRAEVNDVVSTLLMGANGLVLAAETAIGAFPAGAVAMVSRLIDQYRRWTPNSSIPDILHIE